MCVSKINETGRKGSAAARAAQLLKERPHMPTCTDRRAQHVHVPGPYTDMHREAKGVFSFPYTFFDGVRLQYVRGVSQNMQVRLAAAPRLHTCSHALQTDVQSSSSPPRTVGSERKADEEGWR